MHERRCESKHILSAALSSKEAIMVPKKGEVAALSETGGDSSSKKVGSGSLVRDRRSLKSGGNDLTLLVNVFPSERT